MEQKAGKEMLLYEKKSNYHVNHTLPRWSISTEAMKLSKIHAITDPLRHCEKAVFISEK